MKSELEKRIMRRIYFLSLYKSFRNRVPLKVLLLAIMLSLSTKMISYQTIYGYLTDGIIKDKMFYIYQSVVSAPLLKLLLVAIVVYLVVSVIVDVIKNARNKKMRALSIK